MLDLSAFSCELAAEATVAEGEWVTWADTNLFVKCIFKTRFKKLGDLFWSDLRRNNHFCLVNEVMYNVEREAPINKNASPTHYG